LSEFIIALPSRIQEKAFLKLPREVVRWPELKEQYENQCRIDVGGNNIPLKKMIAKSRICICSYPQTTFTECMLSGKPTILLFEKDLSIVHEGGAHIMAKLVSTNIVFYEAAEAANFVTQIWDEPQKWWALSQVQNARMEFLEFARIHSKSKDEWKSFMMGVKFAQRRCE
jgi:putative transferase (TIGR04331 family)